MFSTIFILSVYYYPSQNQILVILVLFKSCFTLSVLLRQISVHYGAARELHLFVCLFDDDYPEHNAC
jgi:hypothetical protein